MRTYFCFSYASASSQFVLFNVPSCRRVSRFSNNKNISTWFHRTHSGEASMPRKPMSASWQIWTYGTGNFLWLRSRTWQPALTKHQLGMSSPGRRAISKSLAEQPNGLSRPAVRLTELHFIGEENPSLYFWAFVIPVLVLDDLSH